MARSDPPPAPSRRAEWLEIVGLWCLAILQPLLDLVGRNAPFLLHYRVDGVDLALWMGAVALGPPLLLWLGIEALGRWRGPALGERAQAVVLGGLVALMAFGLLRRLGDPVPVWLLPPLGVSAAWLIASLVPRLSRTRRFFAWLTLALPLVVALFWTSPAASAARRTARHAPGTAFLGTDSTAARPASLDLPPVVLVVFDELPLVSLLDADRGIDDDLCPNLARLAESATWFRNARTVWPWTNPSLVSMLIGRATEERPVPTRAAFPENLLTWLEPTHEVWAFEPLTTMAPPGAVELLPRPGRWARVRGLVEDSLVIVGHQLLPPGLGGWLPPIDNRWGDFLSLRVVRGRADPEAEPLERTAWSFALADGRSAEFDAFVESIGVGARPALHFAHVMLPHMPYRYLPSGRVYGGRPVYERPATAWSENDWFALETYQRHLLQVGFVDRLVGRLIERLRSTGLWERTLLIVTADHGASHWPGQDRRAPEETEHPDDIYRVPLIVKAPDQTAGGSDDRPALTIDILPTVADALARPTPWPTEGRSLLDRPGGPGAPGAAADFLPDEASLTRKLELFDPAAGDFRWVRFGPYREWIGREVADLPEAAAATADCTAELDQQPVLDRWQASSRYSPALLTGDLACESSLAGDAFVLAALNGRIAGSGAAQQIRGGRALFAVMAAEAALKEGANEVRLFVVSGRPGERAWSAVRLRSVAARG